MKARFEKKLGDIDENWKHTKLLGNTPDDILSFVRDNTNIHIENFIVFTIWDPSDFFGIHTEAVFYRRGDGFLFIPYTSIWQVDIKFDISKESDIKREARWIDVKFDNDGILLTCDKEGAVYVIKRLIDFGVMNSK